MQQVFEVRDGQGAPVVGALLQAVSPKGNWQAMTDSVGQFVANLGPGVYVVTATKNGITTAPQSVNVGPVQIVLQSASVLFRNHRSRRRQSSRRMRSICRRR